jgi:hypothetical protein
MQWSKLKKRVERRFSPQVGKRVQVHFTTYRRPWLGKYGRGWVALDKEEILTASEEQYGRGVMKHGGAAGDHYFKLEPILASEGFFSESSFLRSLHESLSVGISDALESPNVLIRGIATLDSRVGQRRLSTLTPENEHPVVARLINLRLQAVSIKAKSEDAL